MPRTTLIGPPLVQPTDDNAAMQDFVRVLVDIAAADYTAEQLFADDALHDCLRVVLAKNRGLPDFGGNPWPEACLVQAARSHLNALRVAKRH